MGNKLKFISNLSFALISVLSIIFVLLTHFDFNIYFSTIGCVLFLIFYLLNCVINKQKLSLKILDLIMIIIVLYSLMLQIKIFSRFNNITELLNYKNLDNVNTFVIPYYFNFVALISLYSISIIHELCKLILVKYNIKIKLFNFKISTKRNLILSFIILFINIVLIVLYLIFSYAKTGIDEYNITIIVFLIFNILNGIYIQNYLNNNKQRLVIFTSLILFSVTIPIIIYFRLLLQSITYLNAISIITILLLIIDICLIFSINIYLIIKLFKEKEKNKENT